MLTFGKMLGRVLIGTSFRQYILTRSFSNSVLPAFHGPSNLTGPLVLAPAFPVNRLSATACLSCALRCQCSLPIRQGPLGKCMQIRTISSQRSKADKKHTRTVLIYICAIGIGMVGMTYAGVPLYRIFCQATGLGGQPTRGHDVDKVDGMSKVDDKVIRIQFNADTASSMQWSFRPQQTEIKVAPGETALAFYTAKNPTDKPIVGISTYNVVPFEAGQYFNKIQCFCFEEQRLNPHEQVDMPVFFYIDPEFAEDPKTASLDRIILSYTFFEAKEGFEVPIPPYLQQWRSAV